MKKDVLFITAHSLIDTITNSSSEIFICGADKSLKFVKRYLKNLLKTPIKLQYEEESECLFNYDQVFGEVYVVDDTNVDKVIDLLVLDYGLNISVLNYNHDTSGLKQELSESAGKEQFAAPPGYYEVTDKYKFILPYLEHKEHNEQVQRQRTAAWDKAKEEYINLHGDVIRKTLLGKICIESLEDNSIPYELFGLISTDLNAYHMHLG